MISRRHSTSNAQIKQTIFWRALNFAPKENDSLPYFHVNNGRFTCPIYSTKDYFNIINNESTFCSDRIKTFTTHWHFELNLKYCTLYDDTVCVSCKVYPLFTKCGIQMLSAFHCANRIFRTGEKAKSRNSTYKRAHNSQGLKGLDVRSSLLSTI